MNTFLNNKKAWNTFVFTIATMLTLTLISPSFSMQANASALNSDDIDLSTHEDQLAVDQLAEEMEFLFTEATTLIDDQYVLNEKVIIDKFGEDSLASISSFIDLVNGEELHTEDLINVPNIAQGNIDISNQFSLMSAKKQTWKECVGSKILDATGIGFISGGLWKLIERNAWKQVAIELAKIAGKNAIKGGIVGFTASLAWFAVKCK